MSAPVAEPQVKTPAESEAPGFSLEQFYGKGQEQPKAPVEPPSTPQEVKDTGEPTPEASPKSTPTSEPEESATPDGDKPMSKHEREKFKLREKARRAEEAQAKAEARAKELEERYGETPEAAPVDELAQIRMEERANVSRSHFIERHGKDLLHTKFVAEDSPWREIELQAKDGDLQAMRMLARAAESVDPYQEALTILEEVELFEKYQTRSIPDLLKKALAEQEATVKAAVLAELTPTRAPVGEPPATLDSLSGGNPPSSGQVPESFSLSTYYQRK